MAGERFQRLTGSGILSRTPCFVSSVIITPTAASVGKIEIYDGTNDADPLIATILTGSGQTKQLRFWPSLETHRGLYVKHITNVAEVVVQYQRDRE